MNSVLLLLLGAFVCTPSKNLWSETKIYLDQPRVAINELGSAWFWSAFLNRVYNTLVLLQDTVCQNHSTIGIPARRAYYYRSIAGDVGKLPDHPTIPHSKLTGEIAAYKTPSNDGKVLACVALVYGAWYYHRGFTNLRRTSCTKTRWSLWIQSS